MPRAAERPTRNPVKLPGPVVAAMRSSASNATPEAFITRAISGIRASAWPRFIGCDSCASGLFAWVSSTAAAQAPARYRWRGSASRQPRGFLVPFECGAGDEFQWLCMAGEIRRNSLDSAARPEIFEAFKILILL